MSCSSRQWPALYSPRHGSIASGWRRSRVVVAWSSEEGLSPCPPPHVRHVSLLDDLPYVLNQGAVARARAAELRREAALAIASVCMTQEGVARDRRHSPTRRRLRLVGGSAGQPDGVLRETQARACPQCLSMDVPG